MAGRGGSFVESLCLPLGLRNVSNDAHVVVVARVAVVPTTAGGVGHRPGCSPVVPLAAHRTEVPIDGPSAVVPAFFPLISKIRG